MLKLLSAAVFLVKRSEEKHPLFIAQDDRGDKMQIHLTKTSPKTCLKRFQVLFTLAEWSCVCINACCGDMWGKGEKAKHVAVLMRKTRCNSNANERNHKTWSNLPGGLSFLNIL